MSDDPIYEQFKKTWEKLIEISEQSIRKASDIYFDLIKLIIAISIPLIPLIAILFNAPNVSKAKKLILFVVLLLIASISFGITALINSALAYKKSSDNAAKELLKLSEIGSKGQVAMQEYFAKGLQELRDKGKLYEDLDYKWAIIQLSCFIAALTVLFVSLCKIF